MPSPPDDDLAQDLPSAPIYRPNFWRHYALDALSTAEWEALCDGCGLCCLVKLQDEDTQEVVYTRVACMLLDTKTASCRDYPNRQQQVPDCLQLTPDKVPQLPWLPETCAYRRVHEERPLPEWHHLLTGSRQTVHQAKRSAAGRCISELNVAPDDIETQVIRWVSTTPAAPRRIQRRSR